MEKAQKAAREAKQLQEFHRSQMAERRARDNAEINDRCNYTKKNMNLLKVEFYVQYNINNIIMLHTR